MLFSGICSDVFPGEKLDVSMAYAPQDDQQLSQYVKDFELTVKKLVDDFKNFGLAQQKKEM